MNTKKSHVPPTGIGFIAEVTTFTEFFEAIVNALDEPAAILISSKSGERDGLVFEILVIAYPHEILGWIAIPLAGRINRQVMGSGPTADFYGTQAESIRIAGNAWFPDAVLEELGSAFRSHRAFEKSVICDRTRAGMFPQPIRLYSIDKYSLYQNPGLKTLFREFLRVLGRREYKAEFLFDLIRQARLADLYIREEKEFEGYYVVDVAETVSGELEELLWELKKKRGARKKKVSRKK